MTFETMSDAFDYAREANHPIKAEVSGSRWVIYPSGHAKELSTKQPRPGTSPGHNLRQETDK